MPEPDFSLSRRTFVGATLAGSAALLPFAARAASPARAGSDELAWTPAWRLQELFRARKLSPLEYAQSLVARCERLSHLGAFITVFPERYLEQARIATDQRDRSGLLHGLPVSIKDNIITKGMRTTYGSRVLADYVPETDSVPSERIKRQGGIIFAKSNLSEFALYPRSINYVAREAVNAWDQTRTAGGSSGGAATATAAGLGPLAVGTDGGGSTRLPSAYNGVFGMLASRGRVPNGAGVYTNPNSGIGPITRDVRDAALLLQVMAGPDPRDAFSQRTPVPDYLGEIEKGVKGVRVAWSADLGRVVAPEAEIIALCHDMAKTFRSLGAQYSEPSIRLENTADDFEPDKEFSTQQVNRTLRAIKPDFIDSTRWLMTLPPEKAALLTPYARSVRNMALNMAADSDLDSFPMTIPPAVRYRTKNKLGDLFKAIDLLVCPTSAIVAFTCGRSDLNLLDYSQYTQLINHSGYCAASVPAGFFKGMPVALQIIGRPGEEALVLRAARALEKARPWADKRPTLA